MPMAAKLSWDVVTCSTCLRDRQGCTDCTLLLSQKRKSRQWLSSGEHKAPLNTIRNSSKLRKKNGTVPGRRRAKVATAAMNTIHYSKTRYAWCLSSEKLPLPCYSVV